MLPEVRITPTRFGKMPLLVRCAYGCTHRGIGRRRIIDLNAINGKTLVQQFVDLGTAQTGNQPPQRMRYNHQTTLLLDGLDTLFDGTQRFRGTFYKESQQMSLARTDFNADDHLERR